MKKLVLFVVLVFTMGTATQGQKTIIFRDSNDSIVIKEMGGTPIHVLSGKLDEVPGTPKEKWEAIMRNPEKITVHKDSVVYRNYGFTMDIYQSIYEIWYDNESQFMRHKYLKSELIDSTLDYDFIKVHLWLIFIAGFLVFLFLGRKVHKILSIVCFILLFVVFSSLSLRYDIPPYAQTIIMGVYTITYLGGILLIIMRKRKQDKKTEAEKSKTD